MEEDEWASIRKKNNLKKRSFAGITSIRKLLLSLLRIYFGPRLQELKNMRGWEQSFSFHREVCNK